MIRFVFRQLLIAGLFLVTHTTAGAADANDSARLASQRALYQQTRAQLQNGQADAAAGMAALRDYPLYPYLELAQLTNNLDQGSVDNSAIDDFLRRNAGSLVAEQLRNTWLAILAQGGRWTEYRNYYSYYGYSADNGGKTAPSKLQQCWNLEALYQTQQIDAALQQTAELWLNTDLPDACDAPLKRWLDSNQRNEALVWQRLILALERKQEQLARSLTVNIREPYKLSAEYALLLYRDPAALGNLLPQLTPLPEAGSVLTLALKSLAKRDVDGATALWRQLRENGQLTPENSNAVRAEIGRQQIAQRGVDALPWLLQNDANGEDSYLLEWRVRLALRGGDWPSIARWIEQLPAALAQTPRWSYWHARALAAQTDQPQEQQRAAPLFRELAKDRSFYGFLAADQLKIAYQLNDQPLPARATLPTTELPSTLLRAREFYALGETASARREWLFAVRGMNADEQQTAALWAEQWSWHDRAIQTATLAGAWNDLQLRFPLAYRDSMQRAAIDTALSTQWLMAIARQESTFMPDARSPVGALGLMQLMPDTARQVARGLHIKIDTDDLLQPGSNIRLGSTYLSEMLRRYRGNRVLATAAYNAGPNRISNLLKNQGTATATDIWVETLPYKETREYVQNVLAFTVIYARRLGLNSPLLNSDENTINSAPLQVGSATQ
ncbi:MAG TPA: transglycosylase SLT domain-containing protein [Spongiibacteraceae bacterium]|nr:transglycosylase SLT domain-containing protein [Spongiibacteraceae bacterium]